LDHHLRVLNEAVNIKAGSLALFTAILWGGNAVTIKIGLGGIPPLAMAGFRFCLGALMVLIWTFALRVPLGLKSGELTKLLKLGVLFTLQIYLLNGGTQLTLAGRSAVFISTYPFFTSFFAHFFIPEDRISRLKIIGMILSFLGLVLVFSESFVLGNLHHLTGDVMVLASAFLLGARLIFMKRLTQGIHPGKVLLWQVIFGVPAFFILSGLFEGSTDYRLSAGVISAVLYQGLVVAGLCFIIHTTLLRRYSASRLTAFGFITPVTGVLMSNLLLGEGISPGLLGSVLLVGAGITIVNRAA
jgi:drug/metabolite transporter (DMT)-like permease